MDKNLFSKYTQQIHKQKNIKQEIISYIKEKTSIELLESEIEIDVKKIHIYTSSIKKTLLFTKNIKNIIKEKGYSIQ